MNDAPKQIWIDDEKYEHHWHILPEGMIPPVDYRHVLGRYIRADLYEVLQAENARLRAALTPSATTKAAYMGEIDCDCPTQTWRHHVPWTSIKQIMRMILEQAALSAPDPAPEAPDMTRPGNVTHET